MDSFYAGLPGTPFILKQSFYSIADMETEFNKQEEYTDVFYGEYCIINTINKSHPDNGKLYRRGYSGPEYIGQIVGPSGLFCDNIRIITRDKSSTTVGECYDDSIGKNVTVCNAGVGTWGTPKKDNSAEDGSNSESSNPEGNSGSTGDSGDSENTNIPEREELSFEAYNFAEFLDESLYKQQYKIIVYDIYENISDEKNGGFEKKTIATCFAGVYDVLESMQEYPNGKTVLRYSSSKDEILSETLVDDDGNPIVDSDGNKVLVPIVKSWLENVSFNPDTGQLVFTGNGCNETLNKVFFLKLLKNVKLDPDGTIHFLYTNQGEQGEANKPIEVDDSLDKVLTWIKDAHFNKNTGQLQIHFNNDKVSPVVIENLAAFDSHYNYKYSPITSSYYFEEILSRDGGFYVKMKEVTKEDLVSSSSGYTIDSAVTAENILSNKIFYPALTTVKGESDEYSYEPCYTNIPFEVEIERSTATRKEFYCNSEEKPLVKTKTTGEVDENNKPIEIPVISGELVKKLDDNNYETGSLVWKNKEPEKNVLYYDNDGKKIAQTELQNINEKTKAQIFFNGSGLYEIDWPLAENGQPIVITENETTYRKISFKKEVEETNGDKTGSLTFGEDDGSFSYKFIGQEGVSGQFNFVKKVEENDLGYTAVTNTSGGTSLSKTQNFRTPKEFFFFDKNDPSYYSFHLFANYSYPELPEGLKLIPLSEKKDDDSAKVGAYYISLDPIEIYLGVEGEEPYQKVESSSEIFCYQETCYQIGENGAVEEFFIEKDYPFTADEDGEKNKAFWENKAKKGYWKDLGKISDGLTNDLPSLLANIAYIVEAPNATDEEAKNQILWG